MVDSLFRGASFCKYVCPIGQFHFVSSLVSPFEVRLKDRSVCATCATHDCLRGNAQQRGCELDLYIPRKAGNMDCTFCLDCVRACPHDNVGVLATIPGSDLWSDRLRSSIGLFSRRPDLAALALVVVLGGFAGAAAMVEPLWVRSPSAFVGTTLMTALALASVISSAAGRGAGSGLTRGAGVAARTCLPAVADARAAGNGDVGRPFALPCGDGLEHCMAACSAPPSTWELTDSVIRSGRRCRHS